MLSKVRVDRQSINVTAYKKRKEKNEKRTLNRIICSLDRMHRMHDKIRLHEHLTYEKIVKERAMLFEVLP